MSRVLVGRDQEKATLQGALDAAGAELIAVYGRRRVGKTFLIRHFGVQVVTMDALLR